MLLKSATWVAFVLFFLLVIWTEFLLFYVSLLRCTWPQISESTVDKFIYPGDNSKPVKILLISDTHIGSRHQWIDKTRRHWLLKRAFKTAMGLYHPDVVLHLGDLLDYGFFEPEEAFEADVKIAQNIFAVDSTTVFKVVPGNHDIGFHHRLHPYTYARFHRAFRDHSPGTRAGPNSGDSGDVGGGVRLWAYRGLLFVFINSMALGGDGCRFCRRAEEELQLLTKRLQCLRGELALQSCQDDFKAITEPGSDVIHPGDYSHPILIQHFPLYRPDEAVCETGMRDSLPEGERHTPYKSDFDCLSDSATKQLFFAIRPNLVFGGHTHYYCHRNHTVRTRTDGSWRTEEWTLPAFSYRVSKTPGFILLHASRNGYAVRRCHLPTELTIGVNYAIGLLLILFVYLRLRRRASRLLSVPLRHDGKDS
ncbi:Metallophosphoesterase [Echinococcus granulosus]|uniref:Metallophosphoesterase n=1 Tax=Echinococcus granulosus TaxID=6210 RepID=W6UWD3_ECHGR|nr:Metallophosphoesterase [Echinococcus granulosus]EUB57789.1 Metallophosphoesterase [Echinococcus granulosus]